ncbi:hypothetical protein A176_005347 [Myxococcus hansupus]|uniref:Lipoprotein n=1 Tax=Pseudomyxococcus hansupus TaxID=1297742 RepID=A0A0H4X472_9BACT|nr:hypothetical protein [Myxococcus hansupus]AKQ68435.1 hypothetical protein A176_005347 [Myxococcus hansupus]
MRILAATLLVTLCGCSYIQVGTPGGPIDLSSPRGTTVGVWVSPPRDVTLEETPEGDTPPPESPEKAATATAEKTEP